MPNEDLGLFKVSVSPSGTQVALKMEMRSLDALRKLVARSQATRTDDLTKFNYNRDMTLGALDQAMGMLRVDGK